MAKLNKIKFNLIGTEFRRTTFKRDIELYLYYNTENEFFYFDSNEIKKYYPTYNNNISFSKCESKRMAIEMIKLYINGYKEKKRMLRVEIDIVGEIDINKKDLCKQLQEMTGSSEDFKSRYDNENKREISLKFKRVLEIKSDGQSDSAYIDCDENWNEGDSYYHYGRNLIEWSEEIESFLIKMQQQMDMLSKNLINFFNVQDVEELKQRISETPLMITNNK